MAVKEESKCNRVRMIPPNLTGCGQYPWHCLQCVCSSPNPEVYTRAGKCPCYYSFMFRDLRFGLRQLIRYRTTSVLVILLLAVGLGANTLVFSLVDGLLLTPLPVRNPQNLYLLERNRAKQVRPDTFFAYLLVLSRRGAEEFISGGRGGRTGVVRSGPVSDALR